MQEKEELKVLSPKTDSEYRALRVANDGKLVEHLTKLAELGENGEGYSYQICQKVIKGEQGYQHRKDIFAMYKKLVNSRLALFRRVAS